MKLRLGVTQAEFMVDAIAYLRRRFHDTGDNLPRLKGRMLYIPAGFPEAMQLELKWRLKMDSEG